MFKFHLSYALKFPIKNSSSLPINVGYLMPSYRRGCVCVWLDLCERWTTANEALYQTRPRHFLSLSSRHFSSCSPRAPSYPPPPRHLSSHSCSEVALCFSGTPFSLSCLSFYLLSFPFADEGWPPRAWALTHTCMEMIKSRDVHCTWTGNRVEPAHTCRIFRLKLWIASRPEMKTG